MALQRTRRPRFRTGRSLRSLGSPLNACSLGALVRTAAFAAGIFLASSAQASSAVRLALGIPGCTGVCPHPIPDATIVDSRFRYPIYVITFDATDNFDLNYKGCVRFSSSDPFATLPAGNVCFASGGITLHDAITLRTLGTQTITVTDVAGILTSGTISLNIVGPALSESIPALSTGAAVALGCLLLISGIYISWSRN